MTFLSYYGLSFNPFDKQQVKEKDRFFSNDLQEMMNRLDFLKDTRGIGVFTAGPGMGKSFGLRCFTKALNLPLSAIKSVTTIWWIMPTACWPCTTMTAPFAVGRG